MLDMITIALFVLALISLVVAAVAIGWLSVVSSKLSVLGKKVLESEDIGRIMQAADKTASFESRVNGCEIKADENQNQLAEFQIKLDKINAKQGTTGQIVATHTSDITRTSEVIATIEPRLDGFENNIREKLNQLTQLETKIDEVTAKLQSIEQKTNSIESGLTETDRSINSLTEKIESLEKFQATTEKTHNLLQAAFTDTQVNTLQEESQEIISEVETVNPEDFSQEHESEPENNLMDNLDHESVNELVDNIEHKPENEIRDEQEQPEDQKTFGKYNFDL